MPPPYGHFPVRCYELINNTLLPFVGPSFFRRRDFALPLPPAGRAFFEKLISVLQLLR